MKNRKLLFMVFTLFCFTSAGVCLIVDMAVNKQFTWSAYPLLSILFAWVVVSPAFMQKCGIILSLCTCTLAVLPYLFFLSQITPIKDWFAPIAIPCAICGVISVWILYPVFRYTKINIWYKATIAFLILAVICTPITNYFVDIYLGNEPYNLYRIISLFSCIVVTAAIGILGYMKQKNKTEKDTH